ncbi:hypothetical protein OOT55_17630 [Marinimicrobium sp. C6131]|uniref:DUF6795 domain-containing protein n=1 Tax=Marinimicrobium sp. C6131 TaxID=3022676 RepID=UPI00223C935C|nr:DUF6795 domain-containing protein [Marinimicrobium sp. C6131]UZJ44456.1 hypothetical protein OOT55_17630 [Marinimicrobium sp. C6131]
MYVPPIKLMAVGLALVSTLVATPLLLPQKGFAMSLFGKKQSVVVASPLEGIITHRGKPAAGAKVEQFLRWKDENGETRTVETDKSGHFLLPAREDEVKISSLSRFVIHQKITVHFQGEQTVIWSLGTAHRELYGELGKKPEDFHCELTGEPATMEMEDGLLYTLCHWN